MARASLLTAPVACLSRAWRRCRATGGGWRTFAGMLLRSLPLLVGWAGAAVSCEIRPMSDCHGAVLSGIDLRKRNLRGIDFSGADLRDADMRGADLAGANLAGADARRAGFEKAYLGHTILDGADLDGARLRRRDVLSSTSLAGMRMPDGSRCPVPSMGDCWGARRGAWRARRLR